MASQACSSDVHLSIKWPERVLYRFNNLIKFDTYMYRISRRISLNLFFQLVLGTRFIQESNTVITLVLLKIIELEIRKSSDFLFLFNFLTIW